MVAIETIEKEEAGSQESDSIISTAHSIRTNEKNNHK